MEGKQVVSIEIGFQTLTNRIFLILNEFADLHHILYDYLHNIHPAFPSADINGGGWFGD